jgi:hypothetical protein
MVFMASLDPVDGTWWYQVWDRWSDYYAAVEEPTRSKVTPELGQVMSMILADYARWMTSEGFRSPGSR